MTETILRPTVAIIGAGPSGLRAARELAPVVSGSVLVIDREREAGGIPRHADHLGYGIRDLRRFLTGPVYARRLVDDATRAGAEIRTGVQAVGWEENRLQLVSPAGPELLDPEVLILATGARERPRAARMVPGDRAAGVYTTGQLQQLVHLKHRQVGTQAVVVGAELVSWSAVMTLRQAGCRTQMLVTSYPRPDSYRLFCGPGSLWFRTRVATSSRVVRVEGRGRVEAVVVENLTTGQQQRVECDTVVFTGDWVPDHELARMAGIEIDPGSLSPSVDASLRTSRDGVFAIGNLVHPVETADVAALDGVQVTRPVQDYLLGKRPSACGYRIVAEAPLRWVTPNRIDPGDPTPARGRLVAWTDRYLRTPTVSAYQDGRLLRRLRLPWPAAPGRAFRVPAQVLAGAQPGEAAVTISVA
ncbi:MAG: FAD-dependent oxidoreductase [Actinomycetia bacterium]|nr:FAD-dependent oxidoreductase [Actinomycetes bacterium]